MSPKVFKYEKNEAFVELSEDSDAVFESSARLLVFAASIGYTRGLRVDKPKKNAEMRWNYIVQNNHLSVIVSSIAYADTSDPDVILDSESQIESLVAYGAGGARIIKDEVIDKPGKNLDNLTEFIQRHRDVDKLEEQVGILERIESEISSIRSSE